MKRFRFLAFAALASALVAVTHASANFANPSFEDPLTSDGPPFVGFWEAFQGAGAISTSSTAMPRTGEQHVDLSIDIANTFAGVFQDIPNLTAGDTYNFSGWHKTISDPLNVLPEVRIEWRDSVANVEISRTPNLSPIPTSDYTQFLLTAVVPAGADTARAVYAIQSFIPGGGSSTVFLDDFSFQVPEPTTMTLLGLSGLAFVGLRRRRA